MLDLFSQAYKGKKVFVTGDSGFKGSWLCIWLLELGADVYGYSLPPLTSKANYTTSDLQNKIHHIDGDIRYKEKLQSFISEIKPDIAFHLAAQPLVIDSYNNPHYNFETNLMGTVNFFEAIRNCNSIKAAINVTTDKCYKNKEWIWGYRENEAMGGDDPYSASKACSELITHSYIESFFSKENTANVSSARSGNVIGGGDWADSRILADLIKAYQSDQTLIIRNPQAVRPWQFVLEPLYGYLKLGEKLISEGKPFSGGWNFGPSSYQNYSVSDVIQKVKEMLPTIKIIFLSSNEKFHEAELLKLDISKAVNILGWKPKLNFEQSIRMTIEGYLHEIEQPNAVYDFRVEQIKKYCQT